MFRKKGLPKDFANSQESACARVSFLIELQEFSSTNYKQGLQFLVKLYNPDHKGITCSKSTIKTSS